MGIPAVAHLILTNIPRDEWEFPITADRQVIGRSTSADIPILPQFVYVSRRHAEVWTDKYGMWIRDLGSRGGTEVNSLSVAHVPQARIAVGDTIWLAGAELQVVPRVAARPVRRRRPNAVSEETPIREDSDEAKRHAVEQLTFAELDVYLCLTRGYYTDAEIGRLLHRSPLTVQTEIRNICQKLGVRGRMALLCWIRRESELSTAAAGGVTHVPARPQSQADDTAERG